MPRFVVSIYGPRAGWTGRMTPQNSEKLAEEVCPRLRSLYDTCLDHSYSIAVLQMRGVLLLLYTPEDLVAAHGSI